MLKINHEGGIRAIITDKDGKPVFAIHRKELERHTSAGGTTEAFVRSNLSPQFEGEYEAIMKLLVNSGFIDRGSVKHTCPGKVPEYVISGDTLYRNGTPVITKSKIEEECSNGKKIAAVLKDAGIISPYPVIHNYLEPAGFVPDGSGTIRYARGKINIKKDEPRTDRRIGSKVNITTTPDGKSFLGIVPIDLLKMQAEIAQGRPIKHISNEIRATMGESAYSEYFVETAIRRHFNIAVTPRSPKSVSSTKPALEIQPPAVRIVKAAIDKPNQEDTSLATFLSNLTKDSFKDDNVILRVIELVSGSGLQTVVLSKITGVGKIDIEERMKAVKIKYGIDRTDEKLNRFILSKDVIKVLKPQSILEVCAGPVSLYKINHPDLKVVSNDPDPQFKHDMSMKPEEAAAMAVAKGEEFDMVDIDTERPDSYMAIVAGIKTARKAVCITIPIATLSTSDVGTYERMKAQYNLAPGDSPDTILTKFKNEVKRLGRALGKDLRMESQEKYAGSLVRVVFSVKCS